MLVLPKAVTLELTVRVASGTFFAFLSVYSGSRLSTIQIDCLSALPVLLL